AGQGGREPVVRDAPAAPARGRLGGRRRARRPRPRARQLRRRPDQLKTCVSRKTFSTTITAATSHANAVVVRRFTSEPISSRRLVNQTSGTSAKGIPKLSTTWLSTSVRDGSAPA